MGRRMLAGLGQLALSVAGFVLLVGWMCAWIYGSIRLLLDQPGLAHAPAWMAEWGGFCFGTAWLWALLTSLSMLRRARRDAPPMADVAPPVIGGPPTDAPVPPR
jgi:hypothetical protein